LTRFAGARFAEPADVAPERLAKAMVLDDFAPAAEAAVALATRCGYVARAAQSPTIVIRWLHEWGERSVRRNLLLWDDSVALSPEQAEVLDASVRAGRLRIVQTAIDPRARPVTESPAVAAVLRKPLLNPEALLEALNGTDAAQPRAPLPAPPTAIPADESPTGLVLVVDDDAVNRMVLTKQLVQLGCRVESAQNGAEAVALARLHHYDLVLMDCRMPVMDGYSATREIRRAVTPPPPIVSITANTTIEDREACTNAGMVDFVSKPVRLLELQRVLRRWLRPRSEA